MNELTRAARSSATVLLFAATALACSGSGEGEGQDAGTSSQGTPPTASTGSSGAAGAGQAGDQPSDASMRGGAGGQGGAVVEPPAPQDAARTDSRSASDAASARDGRATSDARSSFDSDAAPPGRAGWNLVWSDEFDGTTCPDPSNWNFERGFVRNEELQWYQPDNASCENGMLVIEARRETKPNPNYLAGSGDWKRNRANITYTSTSMTSSGKRSFTYGRFETRARIDTRQGSWPAFWTLGQGGWPAGGEVDIMEFYNNNVLANVCRPMGSTCGWSSIRQPVTTLGGAAWTSSFHIWAMEWDAEKIDLLLDEKLVNHFVSSSAVAGGQANPYVGKPQYVLVNQAIGGINGGDPANTAFPVRYEVDYVRVYQRPAAP